MDTVPTVRVGERQVSKLVLGGNMFSGFSHRGRAGDREMRRYYTVARVKETLRRAEQLGINTLVARADNHVIRTLEEYWGEGGAIQWFAQTCSEMASLEGSVAHAIANGAHGVYVHGGKMDFLLANGGLDQAVKAVAQVRAAGLPAGVGGHNPRVFAWAESVKLPVDFYMCSYYDPAPRVGNPLHDPEANESYIPENREAMVATVRGLSKPAIHYKVMAAGRHKPEEALAFAARHLRPQDMVAIGIYTKNKPDMLEEDIRLLRRFGAMEGHCGGSVRTADGADSADGRGR
jgi:hypothetical protein